MKGHSMSTKNLNLYDCSWIDTSELENSTILITGGTGLVGYNILQELTKISEDKNIRILALVRDENKAKEKFKNLSAPITLIVGDVQDELSINDPIHYIIHGANITSSRTFVEQPVETIMTAVQGTKNMLELAKSKKVRAMVYLSSMEVYGAVNEEKVLTEADIGYVNPLNLRSSYPESKRLCETLCVSYASEYGVNVSVARLVQTFGPGIPSTDRRVIIQFIQSAVKNENIEIKASGESSRMYLYTFDAVTALLTLLLKGEGGKAYNIANKSTYCSIKDLAKIILKIKNASSTVLTNTGSEEERQIYPPDSYLYLDVSELENLGWTPMFSLTDGLLNLINDLEDNN